jgi:hypothetical protein
MVDDRIELGHDWMFRGRLLLGRMLSLVTDATGVSSSGSMYSGAIEPDVNASVDRSGISPILR